MIKKILLSIILVFSLTYISAGSKSDTRRIVFERKHSNRKRLPSNSEAPNCMVYALLTPECLELYVDIPDDFCDVSIVDELGNSIFETVVLPGFTELDVPETGTYVINVTTSHYGIYEGIVELQ